MKKILTIILVLVSATVFFSCEKNDNGIDNKNYGPIKVTKVFQHNAKAVKELDPEVGARLGTMIRLEGENFLGIKKITCNGSVAYINPNLLTSKSVIFRIPSRNTENAETPTGDDCEEEFRDKIIISSNGNKDYAYSFHIMGSAPSISGISHCLPNEGSWVTVKGASLKGVNKVVFYNDLDEAVAETENIRGESAKGTGFQFQTPAFPADYEGGYIIAETDNGKAASPNYFYRIKNIFLSKFFADHLLLFPQKIISLVLIHALLNLFGDLVADIHDLRLCLHDHQQHLRLDLHVRFF